MEGTGRDGVREGEEDVTPPRAARVNGGYVRLSSDALEL